MLAQRIIEFRNYYHYSVVVLFCLKVGEIMIFRVKNQIWNYVIVPPNSPHLLRSDLSRTVGVTDNSVKTVYVSDLLRGKFLDKVNSHELVHVFSFVNNLYIPIDVEEQIADFLSTYGRDIFSVADDILERLKWEEYYA